MTPLLALAFLILLCSGLAAWGALRRRPLDSAPFEALRRHGEELASRDRTEGQQSLQAQLRPLAEELHSVRLAQAEKLAEGFRQVITATQEALRASREEQATQLAAVQLMVEGRLQAIQASNEARLEQMRRTVDEKLHETLEKRLGESFNLVAQRLELVQKGLGEMQSLAQDVGGLKRALRSRSKDLRSASACISRCTRCTPWAPET